MIVPAPRTSYAMPRSAWALHQWPAWILMVLFAWTSSEARGYNYDLTQEIKRREQFVLRERPELGPCLRAADSAVLLDPRFDRVRFESSDALHARVTEADRDGHLVRSTRVKGRARVREEHGFIDSYRDVYAICEQRDEAPASVRLELVAR
jgi:hypothetical protein